MTTAIRERPTGGVLPIPHELALRSDAEQEFCSLHPLPAIQEPPGAVSCEVVGSGLIIVFGVTEIPEGPAWLSRWRAALGHSAPADFHPIRDRFDVVINGASGCRIFEIKQWTPSFFANVFWKSRAAAQLKAAAMPGIVIARSDVVGSSQDAAPVGNSAVAAVNVLRDWLSLSIEDIARLIGSSKSSLLYWKRMNTEPRPQTARRLYRLYALIRALRNSVAAEALPGLLSAPLKGSNQSVYDLLKADRYTEAEAALRPVIFRTEEQQAQRGPLLEWPHDEVPPPDGPSLTLRAPTRRARRVRLP